MKFGIIVVLVALVSVLVATFLATDFVSAVSVHAIRGFLSAEIEEKFSAVLWSASERLDLYYDQRLLDVEVFAASDIVTENLRVLVTGSPAARATVKPMSWALRQPWTASPWKTFMPRSSTNWASTTRAWSSNATGWTKG